jgi:hypothetical protein
MHNDSAEPRGPDPQPLEVAWRLRGSTGCIMECSIYIYPDHQAGFSVRIQCGARGVIRDCRVRSVRKARRKAEDWRQTLLTLSEYEECGVNGD